MVFPGIVCVSSTGNEDFQSKDLEILRFTRASVEHHSCSDDTPLCPILQQQDLLSAVQIFCASSLPSALSLSLWSSSDSTVSLLQYWEEVTVDELSAHLHPLPQWWRII